MKVRELIKELKGFENYDILFSSDEELNCLRKDGQVATIKDKPNTILIYGMDGSEVDLDGDENGEN